ncbi:uncharacterized protein C19orf47-like isoform X2 [Athene noctua]|uniref:uncharacterized protein C19orf47-like isoform X2 n=1 Tax=Athene noctua TaxID=126797 RepID=UPI003EB78CB9
MSRARSGPRARLRLPGVPAAPRPPPSRGPRRPRRRLPTARGGPPGPPALEGAPLPVPLPALGWRRRVSPGGAVPCGAPRGGIPVGPGPAAGAERLLPAPPPGPAAAGSCAMVSVTMATSEWIQFFKEAGIPPGPAVNYAVMFVDNRIQKNMLMDLNKEIMNELGITVVGDIIAILKHAKVVYRQEMCKAATELLCPSSPNVQAELRRNANSGRAQRMAALRALPGEGPLLNSADEMDACPAHPSPRGPRARPHCAAPLAAASRMIANSLSRDSPPAAPLPQRPHASTISVTVSNAPAAAKAGLCDTAEERPMIPVKRRRVTAEMEGKYIINMPRGTTPRTKKILEQQAAKGLQRTSVFDRLGAEAKADTATGGKPTGVFSRLGDALGTDGDKATESDDDCSVLQYAGVLKKLAKPPLKESAEPGGTIKAKATSSEAKPVPVTAATQRPGLRNAAGIRTATKPSPAASKIGGGSVVAVPVEAQDGDVTSTKDKSEPEFRVTIKRTWGCGKVSSTSESPGAQMDSAGTISVFKRLGRKPD